MCARARARELVTLHLRLFNALFLVYLHYLPFYLRQSRVESHDSRESLRTEQVAVWPHALALFVRELSDTDRSLRDFAHEFFFPRHVPHTIFTTIFLEFCRFLRFSLCLAETILYEEKYVKLGGKKKYFYFLERHIFKELVEKPDMLSKSMSNIKN